MIKVAIYARYSSEMQSESSLTDQIRVCQNFADRNSWQVTQVFSDRALTGTNMMRSGLQGMLQEAQHEKFDIIIAEALDRFSRNQADIATIYQQLDFNGVKIHTISEGHISELHIGMAGTMNALYSKHLGEKVHRGQLGCVKAGRVPGGIGYGYDKVHKFDAKGELIKGLREINPEKAEVVRRIFKEYNEGLSPRAIAIKLNEDQISCPSSKKGWSQSTINGNRRRGSGILNNEAYIGILVWDRLRYITNPETKKRVSRLNPENEWQRQEVSEWRIIDQDTWDKAKQRQSTLPASQKDFQQSKRPTYLTTGIAKCGCCGSS